MPQIRAIRDLRIAEQNHLLQPHIACTKRLPADTERVFVETELHGVGRRGIYDGLKGEARLLGYVGEAAGIVGIARPICLLPLHQRFEAVAQLVQPLGWNDVLQNDVAGVEESLGIDLHGMGSAGAAASV